jgi:hypothetical protein
MKWGYLIHLGYNMWSDRDYPSMKPDIAARQYLRTDDSLWNDVTNAMGEAGLNLLVIDLGEGVAYQSHPELAVKGSWSVKRLRGELERLRGMGIEAVPKLNFSTAHDAWLGPYSRMVSSEPYYQVCKDLIAEVSEIFDSPAYFHLGMDEETFEHQRSYEYAQVRQHDLWWRDLEFLLEQVENAGPRPWVWSDYVWHHPELFYERMPKSVLQSNWYYGTSFETNVSAVQCYLDLDGHGYDQIPTGSNWTNTENFGRTAEFCRHHVSADRLVGFLMTVWRPTMPDYRFRLLEGVELVRAAKEAYES